MSQDERREAKQYWASVNHDWYHTDGVQRHVLVRAVRDLRRHIPIRSVLEFGCNVGRNRHLLRSTVDPGLDALGFDINEAAVQDGTRRYGLDLRVGDESALLEIPAGRFDCAFTISVLDHVPELDQVRALFSELCRVSKHYVLLLEPFTGKNERSSEEVTRFNYFWNTRRSSAAAAPGC